jgi:hypothetical protein
MVSSYICKCKAGNLIVQNDTYYEFIFIPVGSLLEAEAKAEVYPIKGWFGSTSKEMPRDKES